MHNDEGGTHAAASTLDAFEHGSVQGRGRLRGEVLARVPFKSDVAVFLFRDHVMNVVDALRP